MKKITFQNVKDQIENIFHKQAYANRMALVGLIAPVTSIIGKNSDRVRELLSILENLGEQYNVKTEVDYSTYLDVVCGGLAFTPLFEMPDVEDNSWQVSINLQYAAGTFGKDIDFADALMSIFHEFRHIEQGIEYIEGTADPDMLMDYIVSFRNGGLYTTNYKNLTFEIDASRAGVLQAYNYLVNEHPEIDALKWAQDRTKILLNIKTNVSSLTIDDIDRLFQRQCNNAKYTLWKNPKTDFFSVLQNGTISNNIKETMKNEGFDYDYAFSNLPNAPADNVLVEFTQKSFLTAVALYNHPEFQQFLPVEPGGKYDIEVYKRALTALGKSKNCGRYDEIQANIKDMVGDNITADTIIFQKVLHKASEKIIYELEQEKASSEKPCVKRSKQIGIGL